MSSASDASVLPKGVQVFERGWLSANSILFQGSDGTALVDTGYATHCAQTVALVRAALGARPLDLLLNTHLHSDHCGGNAALQHAYPAVRTRIPPGLSSFVRDWDAVALTYTPTGQQCPRFRFDDVLEPGDDLLLAERAWQIHSAPGHDAHSVILFEPDSRTLISADALWENGFGVVFEELEGKQAFGEVNATLDLIEVLAPRVVIPGHGPVFSDVGQALAVARSRLNMFVNDPRRHARHAAKVLLKFKLLEVQQLDELELVRWALDTAYFSAVHQRFFDEIPLREWIGQLTADLVRSGAARRDGKQVLNC